MSTITEHPRPALRLILCTFVASVPLSYGCDGTPAHRTAGDEDGPREHDGAAPGDSDDPGEAGDLGPGCGNGALDAGEECDNTAVANGACLSDCTIACNAGYGNCDANPANGCEENLTTAVHHCGGCSRDCLWSDCAASRCEPALVAYRPQNTDPLLGNSLAADGCCLYWTSYYGVHKTNKEGGGAIDIATTTEVGPTGIALDSAFVYWTNFGTLGAEYNDGALLKAPKDLSAAPTILASPLLEPVSLVIRGSVLYWTSIGSASQTYADGSIGSYDLIGSQSDTPWPTVHLPVGLVVRDNQVFWGDLGTEPNGFADGAIYVGDLRFPGVATLLAENQTYPVALAVDETDLFWVAYGTPGMSSTNGTVMRIDRLGSSGGIVLAEGLPRPVALALDETFVYLSLYWDFNLWRIKKDGSESSPSVLTPVSVPITAMATDERAVYWLDADNAVYRVAK